MSRIKYILLRMSDILINKVVFTQNNLQDLLEMQPNSTSIIQNNTLTEKNVS